MVSAGRVFVAGIHPSRTWTSGSFESVWWNACVRRLDLGLYSHPKEFLGNGVWTHVKSKGKIPYTGKFPQRRIEPAALWTASRNTTSELFWPHRMGLSVMYSAATEAACQTTWKAEAACHLWLSADWCFLTLRHTSVSATPLILPVFSLWWVLDCQTDGKKNRERERKKKRERLTDRQAGRQAEGKRFRDRDRVRD